MGSVALETLKAMSVISRVLFLCGAARRSKTYLRDGTTISGEVSAIVNKPTFSVDLGTLQRRAASTNH